MIPEKIFDFMGKRHLATALSALLVIVSIASLAVQGLNFGLDFTGGTLVELQYEGAADINQIRSQLDNAGYVGATVINYGSDEQVLIRLQQTTVITTVAEAEAASSDEASDENQKSLGQEILNLLASNGSQDISLQRVEVVGPQIGDELRDDGGLGMLFALAVVMVYVALRFQFKFSLAAVAALIHDVIIVLGLFSLLRLNFDLTVLAAVLAVIGYSLNDTIVVADRIRENFRLVRKREPVEIINISLTQTIGRTMITSLTTLVVLLALFFVGGELIHNFATALIMGVLIGTYSSIYISANMLMQLHISHEDLMPPEVEVEGADQESLMP